MIFFNHFITYIFLNQYNIESYRRFYGMKLRLVIDIASLYLAPTQNIVNGDKEVHSD